MRGRRHVRGRSVDEAVRALCGAWDVEIERDGLQADCSLCLAIRAGCERANTEPAPARSEPLPRSVPFACSDFAAPAASLLCLVYVLCCLVLGCGGDVEAPYRSAAGSVGPGQFTPADRLEALHGVAQAARLVIRTNEIPNHSDFDDLDQLKAAVDGLDSVERYLREVSS